MIPGGNGYRRVHMIAYGTYGTLTIAEENDTLLCHVCGAWKRNLASHARRAHRLSADAYRELAGLNRQTRLVSPGMRAQLRETTAPLIARLRAEGKLRTWREDRDRWTRDKAAAVQTLRQEGLRAEGRQHRRDTLSTHDVRVRLAERRRERNLAGLDRASGEAIRRGLQEAAGVGPCSQCGIAVQRTMPQQRFCPECAAARARVQGRAAKRRARLRRLEGEAAAPRRQQVTAQPREVACSRCGTLFVAASHREKYCIPCRPAVAREYQRDWKRAKRGASDARAEQS
jgi:hypothetical protein